VNKIAKMPKGGRKAPPGAPIDPRSLTTEPVLITKAMVVEK
jgi:hypothetical protein